MDDPRLSLERRLRIAAVVLILAWFFLPGVRDVIPAWVPFLAFAALELNFLVGGLRDWGSAPTKRGRLPQESDIEELGGEEWLEPVLVEVDGRDVWLPEGAESEEDVEPHAAAPAPRLGAGPARRRGGPRGARVRPARAGPARRLGRARRRGPGEDGSAPLGGGGPDRGSRGDRPLRRARRGGRDRPARRRHRRGGRPQRVSDSGDLLPALPPGVQGRRGRLQPDRPCDRRPRPRGLAPARRDRRGSHQLLRLPERRLARPPARALGGNGGPDDAPAARRQRDVRALGPGVPRADASAATAAASTSTPAAGAFPRRRRAARRASSARRRRRRRPRGRTGFPRSGRARQAQPGGPPPAGRDDRRAWPRVRRRR